MKLVWSFLFNLNLSHPSYDFIVIGGGSAGGIVAYELSKKGYKTLLIEMGSSTINANITTPILHLRATEDETITLNYYVNMYPKNVNLRQNVVYPRVAALGGCSLHNAMVSVYPNQLDFDNMVKWTQSEEFSELKMREIFREMEENNYPLLSFINDHGKSDYYGDKKIGKNWFPISYVSLLRQLTFDPQFLAVLLKLKGNPLHDVNGRSHQGKLGADLEGSIFVPINVSKNYDRGDFRAHILEAQQNFGLDIWTDTLVTKILVDPYSKTAYGVQFRKGKYLYKASPLSNSNNGPLESDETVFCKKEVILSAGVFNTPQLLMLSGIGPKEKLENLGIRPIVNLPGVGKNLQDRYEVSYITKYKRDFTLVKNCLFKADFNDPCYRNYYYNRIGPYISNGLLSASIKKSKFAYKTPDLITINVAGRFNGYYHGYSETVSHHLNEISQLIIKARTKNKGGTVELKNKDPTEVPLINFNTISDNPTNENEDIDALVEQIKFLRYQSLNSGWTQHYEFVPGMEYNTDDQLRDFVRRNLWGHHACCTAKLGADSDPLSVLNKRFMVRGVKGLRVVDMSVFPEIPGFFPVLYLQMVATKVARIIAKDYQ